ncbi:MAG: hypothetical protein ABL917_01150 [Parcubacteria group bacterium]
MPNHSKTSDARFWTRWRLSGAVATVVRSVKIVLPNRSELLELFRTKDGPDEPLPGVIAIGGDFYVKSQAALDALLAALHVIGYKVDNLREADYRKRDGVSVKRMEKKGRSLWFGSLNIRRGKCNSCRNFIEVTGIKSHGHKCESCSAVTYYKIIDGSMIRFRFQRNNSKDWGMADISMKAKRWDVEAGYLYLYPEVTGGLWLREDKVQAYLDANSDKWEMVEENGHRLIRVRYSGSYRLEDSDITTIDIHGHHWNHKIVLVWEGQEYDEWFSDFPVRQSVNIYEAWHWAPLPASPEVHKMVLGSIGSNDNKSWHLQDGTRWFTPKMFAEMGKFIRHFTTLDADAWDSASKQFRIDGPGGIDDIAAFCHPKFASDFARVMEATMTR